MPCNGSIPTSPGGCRLADPFVWAACWTILDPGRAPDGKHTLILDTFVPNKLTGGKRWEDIKESYADLMLATFRQYTSVIWTTPVFSAVTSTRLKQSRRTNPCLVGGTTNGGERTLAQTGYFRPVPGYSQYRSPIKNLYMTGASCHPGGGITAMGMVTANVMLEDFDLSDDEL